VYHILAGNFQGKQEEMSEGCANVVSPEGKPGRVAASKAGTE
jgi:hypothetical protein